ncbi:MAG: Stearoyl-CoA 9-desaturase [Bacteriovoracaceae bacterium]|nr:Stearoyl-CoA 9-desaturase [Bacteriovoracaceae bacterium]
MKVEKLITNTNNERKPEHDPQVIDVTSPQDVLQIDSSFQVRTLPPLKEFKVRWASVVTYLILHAGVIAGFWFFTWPAFLSGLILAYISGFIGISVGYHRLLTHKSFDTYNWVKYAHVFLAVIGMQLGPITWVRTHKIHHARADTDEDPHTQIYGWLWGLCGWLMLSHPKIGKSFLGRHLDLKDLTADKTIVFFEKHWFTIFLLSFVPLYFFGGISFVLWCGCFRAVYLSYFIWILNVSGHGTGARKFPTRDRSTNSLIISIASGGEGWHNNHHFMPSSARFGIFPGQLDIGFMWIKFLEMIGLAWNLKTPKTFAPEPAGPSPSMAGP